MPWYRNKKLLAALGAILVALGTPLALYFGVSEELLSNLMSAIVEAVSLAAEPEVVAPSGQ